MAGTQASIESALNTLKKQIESVAKEGSQDEAHLLKIIKTLSDQEVSKEALQSTKIGLCVNTLRKQTKSTVIQIATKELISKWMVFAEQGNNAATTPKAAAPVKARTPSTSSADTPQLQKSLSTSSNPTVGLREGCLAVITNALKQAHGATEPVTMSSREIETSLYTTYLGEADPDDVLTNKSFAGKLKSYRDHVRRVATLFRNPDSQDTRNRLLSGEMSAEEFVNLKPEDLMTQKQREEKEKALKAVMDDRFLASSQGARTTSLMCRKCKGKDAQYTQAQTRSADEPMTTFAMCNLCGYRWKFC